MATPLHSACLSSRYLCKYFVSRVESSARCDGFHMLGCETSKSSKQFMLTFAIWPCWSTCLAPSLAVLLVIPCKLVRKFLLNVKSRFAASAGSRGCQLENSTPGCVGPMIIRRTLVSEAIHESRQRRVGRSMIDGQDRDTCYVD